MPTTIGHGLYRHVLDEAGVIVRSAWEAAVAGYRTVGKCRPCGGALFGSAPSVQGRLTWFAARCSSCGHEVWSPGGRTAPGSSARSGMRRGGWQAQERVLTK